MGSSSIGVCRSRHEADNAVRSPILTNTRIPRPTNDGGRMVSLAEAVQKRAFDKRRLLQPKMLKLALMPHQGGRHRDGVDHLKHGHRERRRTGYSRVTAKPHAAVQSSGFLDQLLTATNGENSGSRTFWKLNSGRACSILQACLIL